MRANLSILGLYNYDNTVLDGLVNALPKDPDTHEDLLDSSLLVNNILLECAELEICYPEPDIMKQAVATWAGLRTSSWLKIAQALSAEYNPIHNYDRYEKIDRTYTPGAGLTTTETVKNPGYNAATLVTAGESSTVNTPDGKSDTDKYDNHMFGNIGVTTAAQMIEGELTIRRNDIYNIITNEFRRRFCLLVY